MVSRPARRRRDAVLGTERRPPRGLPAPKRYALHHAVVRGQRAYCGWWDAGLVILDISTRGRPTLVSQLDFGSDVSHATHTACPLPGRDLLVVTDEEVDFDCKGLPKQVRMVDIADERNPRVVAVFPRPEATSVRAAVASVRTTCTRCAPARSPTRTRSTSATSMPAYACTTSPTRTGRASRRLRAAASAGASLDPVQRLLVGPDGLVYITDRHTVVLYILERTG